MMEEIFDRRAIRLHRKRAVQIGDRGAAFLLDRVCQELVDRLTMVERNFLSVAVTSGNIVLTDADYWKATRHFALVAPVGEPVERWVEDHEETPFKGEADRDLVLSLLTLHETNDTPGALIHIRRRLKPDGLFLGVMPGSGTLQELRESWLIAETELSGGAGPRVHPFADVRTAGSLLQRAGFALPVVDEDKLVVRYADMFALMRDLRKMGAMSALSTRRKQFTSRRVMMRAAEIYQERFAGPDGRIPATFNFIYLSGWAPDSSQQKPARRGSATVSMAEALRMTGKPED